jgi:excisionase family DNA binding protein
MAIYHPAEKDKTVAEYLKKALTSSTNIKLNDTVLNMSSELANVLVSALESVAAGQSFTVITEDEELSTVEAAEILNVSRPFLIKLLDNEEIPHRKVGKHRRVRAQDLMRYKQEIDRKREDVLAKLIEDAQINGMGYD